MHVYDFPRYYEVAFSYRDIPAEVDFIEAIVRRHALIDVRTVLELASGNCPHLIEFCRRGYAYIGVETNEAMIAYSRAKMADMNCDATIVEASTLEFAILRPADCAMVFLGSFYVSNDAELFSHLQAVGSAVRPGGIYILDAAVAYFEQDLRSQSWTESNDGIDVAVTCTTHWVEGSDRMMELSLRLDVLDQGVSTRIEHTEMRKVYTIDRFIELVQLTRLWEYVSSYADFDANESPWEEGRNITVLRRL